MYKLADISTFESLSRNPCGVVCNNGYQVQFHPVNNVSSVSSGRIPHLADISLFENLAVRNESYIPMTREGYNRLKEEIDYLENVEMPKVRDQIATARDEGDLSENAEYHAAREKLGLLQARLDELKYRLSMAQIVDTDAVPHDAVHFGATVTVTRLDTGEQKVYTLVGFGDDDPSEGRISVTSPLAKALLGAKEGDVVTFTTPSGKQRQYRIDHISYGDEEVAEDENNEDADASTSSSDSE